MDLIKDGVKMKGRIELVFRDGKTGRVKKRVVIDNLIVDAGKSAIAARLAGDTGVSNRGEITFAAVGTNGTAPSGSDTTLGTELFRKLLTLRSFVNNIATLQIFFSTSEANGTLLEFGLFGEDATTTPGSGTMFNHVNINEVKTAFDTLTITATITVG